ncbi:MAG: SGNH/GDSL hydrolase family protein [Lentisphaerae bacterium]|nr:SGNH/GDSL hydrolase family protein [Lentisphaerota bacterium]
MLKREYIEWSDIWLTGANDNGLPRVLLVGDSIARSYFAVVEKELSGRFFCARSATSRSVCDPVFGKELALLLDDNRFAVIHFNNGLHGWDYDEETYRECLSKTLDFIVARSPVSRLIWASSTPLRRENNLAELDPETDRVRERNRLAGALMTQRNIPINDLFGLVIDHPEYFGDSVHFNANGQNVLGAQVARRIVEETTRNAGQAVPGGA